MKYWLDTDNDILLTINLHEQRPTLMNKLKIREETVCWFKADAYRMSHWKGWLVLWHQRSFFWILWLCYLPCLCLLIPLCKSLILNKHSRFWVLVKRHHVVLTAWNISPFLSQSVMRRVVLHRRSQQQFFMQTEFMSLSFGSFSDEVNVCQVNASEPELQAQDCLCFLLKNRREWRKRAKSG